VGRVLGGEANPTRRLSFHPPAIFLHYIEDANYNQTLAARRKNLTSGFWDLKRKKYFSSFNLS